MSTHRWLSISFLFFGTISFAIFTSACGGSRTSLSQVPAVDAPGEPNSPPPPPSPAPPSPPPPAPSQPPIAKVSLSTVGSFATYVGGTTARISKTAVTADESVYVLGTTGPDLPTTPDAMQRYAGRKDALYQTGFDHGFLAKMSKWGTSIEYSTYLGGSGGVSPFGLVVDGNDDVYVAMTVTTPDLPVIGGLLRPQSSVDQSFPPPYGVSDIYVMKLDGRTHKILWSTYYGGSRDEIGWDLAVDSLGRIYVTGNSQSADLPLTANGYYRWFYTAAGSFMARFDPRASAGSVLSYTTLLDGGGPVSVAVDRSFNMYVAFGGAPLWSCAYARAGQGCFAVTPGAYTNLDVTNGHTGNILLKFDPTGTQLLWLSYFGATQGLQQPRRVRVTPQGEPVVMGILTSVGIGTFPVTPGAYRTTFPGNYTGWIAKFSSDGSQLLWASYLGAGQDGLPSDLDVNADGDILVVGTAGWNGTLPLTSDARHTDGRLYAVKLSSAGAAKYSSYLPPSLSSYGYDNTLGAALTAKGGIAVGGGMVETTLNTSSGAASTGSGGGYVVRESGNKDDCVDDAGLGTNAIVLCSPTSGGIHHESGIRFLARALSASTQSMEVRIDGAEAFAADGAVVDTVLGVTPGKHAVEIVAHSDGVDVSRNAVVYVEPNEAPVGIDCVPGLDAVNICSPAANSTTAGTWEISAGVLSSQQWISGVVIYLNGEPMLLTDVRWDGAIRTRMRVVPGTYSFTVTAWDDNGRQFSKTIKATIKANY